MPDTITKSITIKAPVNRIYHLWADFENFPQFMSNVKSVRKITDQTSHWVVEGPLGNDLKWEARITDMRENKTIAWQTTEGNVKTSGQVTFNPLAEDQTQATVTLHYVAPGGKVGEAAARMLENPEKKLEEDLRRFKQYAEEHK